MMGSKQKHLNVTSHPFVHTKPRTDFTPNNNNYKTRLKAKQRKVSAGVIEGGHQITSAISTNSALQIDKKKDSNVQNIVENQDLCKNDSCLPPIKTEVKHERTSDACSPASEATDDHGHLPKLPVSLVASADINVFEHFDRNSTRLDDSSDNVVPIADTNVNELTTHNYIDSSTYALLDTPWPCKICDFAKTNRTSPIENSQLSILLQAMSEEINIFESIQRRRIKSDIKNVMECTVSCLEKTSDFYRGCRLIQTGSVAEGTKVLKADEFDFMISLDVFAENDVFEIKENFVGGRYDTYSFFVKNYDLFVKKFPQSQLCLHLKDYLYNTLRYTLLKQLISTFKETIKINGWVCSICDELQKVVKFHIFSVDDTKVHATIDVCLCIPITSYNEINMPLCGLARKTVNYITDLKKQFNCEHFAILMRPYNYQPEHLHKIQISVSQVEMLRLKQHEPSDGRLKTYMLTKLIVFKFLPQTQTFYRRMHGSKDKPTVHHRGECQSCLCSSVSSYALKNILFYMMDRYPEDMYWSDNMLCIRVIEMFSLLKCCQLHNNGSVKLRYHFPTEPACSRSFNRKDMKEMKIPKYDQYFHHFGANADVEKWFEKLPKLTDGEKEQAIGIFHLVDCLSGLENLLYSFSQIVGQSCAQAL